MHYFINETRQLNINAVGAFKRQAESIYDENLSAYVRLILRRPFAKIIVGRSLYKFDFHFPLIQLHLIRTISRVWNE